MGHKSIYHDAGRRLQDVVYIKRPMPQQLNFFLCVATPCAKTLLERQIAVRQTKEHVTKLSIPFGKTDDSGGKRSMDLQGT